MVLRHIGVAAAQEPLDDPLIAPGPIVTAYATDMGVELRKLGVYAAWRSRLGEHVTAEAGVRRDRQRLLVVRPEAPGLESEPALMHEQELTRKPELTTP